MSRTNGMSIRSLGHKNFRSLVPWHPAPRTGSMVDPVKKWLLTVFGHLAKLIAVCHIMYARGSQKFYCWTCPCNFERWDTNAPPIKVAWGVRIYVLTVAFVLSRPYCFWLKPCYRPFWLEWLETWHKTWLYVTSYWFWVNIKGPCYQRRFASSESASIPYSFG